MHEEIEREDALGSDGDTSSQHAKAGARAGLPLSDIQTSPASELPADADEDFAPTSAIVVSREGEMSLWNSSFSEMPETYEV